MIDYAAIGRRIQSYRLKKELTQEYIAEKAGVSIPHLSRIENGSGKPSLQTLVNICNVLNVTIDDIMQDNITASKLKLTNRLYQITNDCTTDELNMFTDIIQTIRSNADKYKG